MFFAYHGKQPLGGYLTILYENSLSVRVNLIRKAGYRAGAWALVSSAAENVNLSLLCVRDATLCLGSIF